MTPREIAEAEAFITAKLGTDPTPEQLRGLCVRVQVKRRRLEQGLDALHGVYLTACNRGHKAQLQNVASIEATFENYVKDDPTDHIYRLRHVKEALRCYDIHDSDPTVKRHLKAAREGGDIPKFEEGAKKSSEKTALYSDDLLAFIKYRVSRK